MDTPEFGTKRELFDFLINNKSLLIAQKKSQMKMADSISYQPELLVTKSDANKEEGNGESADSSNGKDIMVKVVINTTNIIDSHMDMHIDGIWKKSIMENKMLMHLQEHNMKFTHVISDGLNLKAYAKKMTWESLGYDYEGSTEALVFESKITKDRNEFMYDQYRRGYVKNHSVGMRYVQLVLCINDKDCGAEYEAWEKYYPIAVNKEVADDRGYFWVVKEAKVIEGSAVLCGSNYATPTLSVEGMKIQPSNDTENKIEPSNDTQKAINYSYLIKNLKQVQ